VGGFRQIDRPLTGNPKKVIARINVPELMVGQLVGSQTIEPGILSGARGRKPHQITISTTYVVSLAPYIRKVGGRCPLCQHPEDKGEATEEDDWTD
jgi:hypothetical protein